MIACAFASCSKDDVIENGPDAKWDASLTIKIDTNGTKAVGEGDAKINELSVFLYKVSGETKTLAGQQYVEANYNTDGQIVFEDLTAGDTYMCVGFANLGNVTVEQAAGTSPLGLSIAKGLYAADDIPMHGVSDNVSISATGTNEATIKLTRDLAKVELTAVTLNMNYLNVDGTRFGDYTGGTAKFKFNSASINAAVQAGSYTYSNAGTYTYAMVQTPTYVGGLTGWSWNKGEDVSYSNTSTLSGYEIIGTDLAEATQTIGTPAGNASEEDKKAYAAQTVAKPKSVVFYVLPNPAASNTTLTLKGTMTLEDAATASQSNINNTVTGYYNIEIGKDATVSEGFSYDGTGVHANDYFKIQAIVVGTGSGLGGDKPKLIVKTTVAAWNEISQIAPVK